MFAERDASYFVAKAFDCLHAGWFGNDFGCANAQLTELIFTPNEEATRFWKHTKYARKCIQPCHGSMCREETTFLPPHTVVQRTNWKYCAFTTMYKNVIVQNRLGVRLPLADSVAGGQSLWSLTRLLCGRNAPSTMSQAKLLWYLVNWTLDCACWTHCAIGMSVMIVYCCMRHYFDHRIIMMARWGRQMLCD